MSMKIGRTALRALGAAAAASMLALAGLASPGLAHDPGEDDGERKVEKIIILNDHRKGGGGEHRVRTFRIPSAAALADCDGERIAVSESTGGDRERTRVVICSKGDLSAADRAEKLERALARINANDELSAEHKEKVTAALREAIERLRSAH
jgi:hypothetical protein